jgi:hypothetical protein
MYDKVKRLLLAAALAGPLALAACTPGTDWSVECQGQGNSTAGAGECVVTTTSPTPAPTTVAPTTAAPTTPPPTTPAPTTPPPSGSGFPNEASTGHSGTLTGTSDCFVEANTMVANAEFNCSTLEMGQNATVSNSWIHGEVKAYGQSFTIVDSTIQGLGSCDPRAGLGSSHFTATRVHIKNFADGVRAEGDDVVVTDSLIEICPSGHDDGIQVCGGSDCEGADASISGVVFNHNTVNMAKYDSTGNIFVMGDAAVGGQYTNNLLMGGSITVRIHSPGQVVTGNRIVQDSGLHGEVTVGSNGTSCSNTTWSDNKYVIMDGPAPTEQPVLLPYGPDYTIADSDAGVVNCQA